MNAHDVERLLEDRPVPPPPEGLADKIKAEIPEDLGAMVTSSAPVRRRTGWRLAAAVPALGCWASPHWADRSCGPHAERYPRMLRPAVTMVPSPFGARTLS